MLGQSRRALSNFSLVSSMAMSVQRSCDSARFLARNSGDAGGTLMTWQRAGDGSAKHARRQTLAGQTDIL